jgi:hypothetical protein
VRIRLFVTVVVVVVAAVAAAVLVAAATQVTPLAAPPDRALPPAPSPVPGTSTAATAAVPATSAATPRLVSIDTPGYWSWALLDRATLEITGGPDRRSGTSSTESMIKVWIVADRLRTYAESGEQPPAEVLALAGSAIRDSDDEAAQSLYHDGGGDDVIRRLTEICGLTDTNAYPGWWSRTQMSARDAVRMGLCLADGRAAGPQWTDWVLAEMRQVRGSTDPADQPYGGRWGIIDALPADQRDRLAIKNGWTPIWSDDTWHISCLAIADDWILAVQTRYPVDLGLDHGAGTCREVARQVLGF